MSTTQKKLDAFRKFTPLPETPEESFEYFLREQLSIKGLHGKVKIVRGGPIPGSKAEEGEIDIVDLLIHASYQSLRRWHQSTLNTKGVYLDNAIASINGERKVRRFFQRAWATAKLWVTGYGPMFHAYRKARREVDILRKANAGLHYELQKMKRDIENLQISIAEQKLSSLPEEE